MSDATRQLSEAVKARKRATWSAVEAQTEVIDSRRGSARVALAGLALVLVAAVAARVTPRVDSPSARPANVAIVLNQRLLDTKHVAVICGGLPTPSIERVGAVSGRKVIATVGDREMLAFLKEAGLPATLIRIGDEVQIAVHDPGVTPSDRSRELPADGPAGGLDGGIQNF